VAGIDIYHPTQNHLTGAEIALGGSGPFDAGRSELPDLVMETQAQGSLIGRRIPASFAFRLSVTSRPANMVEYWHWGTTANAAETYWRGLLSQDFNPNPTYDEAGSIGRDLGRLGPKLVNMRKHNRIAIYVSNQALTGFNAFRFGWTSTTTYNDVLRAFYDALHRMNAEVDFVDPSTTDLSVYKLIAVPGLYAAADAECLCQGGRSPALHV
jgi:beta-galactosidase